MNAMFIGDSDGHGASIHSSIVGPERRRGTPRAP